MRLRRRRRRSTRRQPQHAKVEPQEVSPPPPGQAMCHGCSQLVPDIILTSRGYCLSCVAIATIEQDHPGGLANYQEQEAYTGITWGWDSRGVATEIIPTATRKPRVGRGIGPKHWLDLTGFILSEMDLPKALRAPRT